MKRNGSNEIRFTDEFVTRTYEPADECRRQVETVRMFEGKDQRLAGLVVAHDGTRPLEGRWVRMARCATCAGINRDLERYTAARALRPFHESDFRPALGAEAASLADFGPTLQTERRKQMIQE